MIVVAFVSQKGGVGKSTLARALAVEAARGGLSVHIADLDVNQGSQIDWHRDRLAAGLSPSPTAQLYSNLSDALKRTNGADMLVLDGPARADKDTVALAKAADLAVLPAGASLDDLRPVVRVAHSLAKAGIPVERIVCALTRISTEAEAEAARAFIAEAGYRVAAGYLPERASYRVAQNGGRAVTEAAAPTLRSAADTVVQSLIDAIPE
ncbi:CobQCobBMinDParA nucleotide binding domain protein [Roseomonas sp. TAS13]|uniref:ParA family protein n=1 Tax=Roseomonas sp. TAS13 TaxID=1926319 RepID=UPI0009690A1B|nr:ParA family protein [Roseomonas sp. TAS13]GAV35463.1 CobQCobBMinDParA nucleotide binding domain protein [Roseomonas sp. TAS13]